jgi:hypothetical protein
MPNTSKIINEIVVNGYVKAVQRNDGIIEINWDHKLEIVEPKHIAKMQEVVAELGGGKKMPLLFFPHGFLNVSKEGAKYATSDEGVRYTLAIAVIVDNLAKKLLMNFFLNFNKPKVPTKGFSNKEDALKWLSKF